MTVWEQVASQPSRNQIEKVVAPSPSPSENHNVSAHKWALQLLLLLILYLEHSGGRGSVCGFWGRAVVWGATIKRFSQISEVALTYVYSKYLLYVTAKPVNLS